MARKKKKKPEESGPTGAPEWVVTFTDMISLLVTFFVLLMTFSSLDAYDLLKVESFLSGGRGVKDFDGFVATSPEDDMIMATHLIRGARQPHSRPPEELHENLEEMGQKSDDEHLELDFNAMLDGLVIEFGDEDTFAPGSTEVSPHLRKSLGEIGRVLENYPLLIVVEGFTDEGFTPSPTYPTAEAMSFARAEAASRALLAESEVVPELVQISGNGVEASDGGESTPSSRARARRVQLRVLSLSRPLAQHFEDAAQERRYR